ncbi:MAB_1171c family putative transporter [Streptomyces sp. NPDC090741]|uniref:MAB_1171c family putative transporter n=1 Tax=Streptomyces sp. NPDC090741 TaxID=3365967 RepID=UPI0037FC0EC9
MALSSLLGGILLLALAWKISQLVKAPSDRVLRSVTLCIVCAALSFLLGLKSGARYVDSLTGDGLAKLLQNALLLVLVYLLQCVFLYAASDRTAGSKRAGWELVPLTSAIGIATWAMAITPETERAHTYATANMREPGVALFYLAAGLYLVYGLALALWWTLRYIRVSHKPLRTGLQLVAAALTIMVLMGSLREALTVTRWAGESVPAALIVGAKLLLDIAIPLFVAGILYPAAATRWTTVRLWAHRRRMYQRLTPLWTALHEAFPEDSLHRTPAGGWRDTLRVRRIHRRYYRRAIECRDGLVRISPYLAELEAPTEPSAPLPPGRAAVHLHEALAAYTAGAPVPGRAIAVALPGGNDLDDDVRQLVALSDALRARQEGA